MADAVVDARSAVIKFRERITDEQVRRESGQTTPSPKPKTITEADFIRGE